MSSELRLDLFAFQGNVFFVALSFCSIKVESNCFARYTTRQEIDKGGELNMRISLNNGKNKEMEVEASKEIEKN